MHMHFARDVATSAFFLDLPPVNPRRACSKRSPSCTCSTFPVGEPEMLSSSKCPVIETWAPGWYSVRSAMLAAVARVVSAAVDLHQRALPLTNN